MFKFISRTAGKGSSAFNLYFLRVQIQPFSSSLLKPIRNSSNQHSFAVTYLINSCGFPPEKAISASKRLKFETPQKPDSVLAFFKNHGFTQTQILRIIGQLPELLIYDTQKTLLPKLEFLKSKGLSSLEVATILSKEPCVLVRSLENIIIPCFNFFSNLLQSEEKTIAAIKCSPKILSFDTETQLAPNMEILWEAGVPNDNIMMLLMKQPRSFFMMFRDGFRQIVEDVVKMGINPSRMRFLIAVRVLRATAKSTWEKKVDVYKKWGCTEDEIFDAFKKHPSCMLVSEDKINRMMDFFVNQMGWESSFVATRPILVSLSLEKRIVPRNAVYQALLSKGLIKTNDVSLILFLRLRETEFLKKVLSYKKDGTELLKVYEEKINLAK